MTEYSVLKKGTGRWQSSVPALAGHTPRGEMVDFGRSFGQPPLLVREINETKKPILDI